MKKLMTLAVILVTMISCQLDTKTPIIVNDTDKIDYRVYEGILPAKNEGQMRYHLKVGLLFNGRGAYKLEVTQLDPQSTVEGYTSEGRVDTFYGGAYNDGKIVYKLFPEDGSEEIYFIVKDDKRLRLVNNELEEFEAEDGISYDIELVE